MTAGLQVFNDHGTYQIDENYRNLVLSQKFTFATAGDHTFSLTAAAPIIALYSDDTSGIVLKSSSVSAGTYTWTVNGIGEAHIFDVCPAASASGAGMQIFDASGNLVYETGLHPMRVRDRLVQRPSWDAIWYPTQTMGQYSGTIFMSARTFTTVEPNAREFSTTVDPYAKPSAEKWGWIVGSMGLCWFANDNFANDWGHTDGTADGNVHKSLPAMFASGDNFKFFMRNMGLVQGGEYYPGLSSSPETVLTFVDLTGL